jgi:hypothetical protein
LFYRVAATELIPHLKTYVKLAVAASRDRRDDTNRLAFGVQRRCAYALRARDHIGESFYAPEGGPDDFAYHFEYLTLLLAGALDAQARIAHRAYGLKGDERYVSFNRESFRCQLTETGDRSLADVLNPERTRVRIPPIVISPSTPS